MLPSIEQRLSLELAAKPVQIAAAIALLDEGATVPFIARYRKEATGNLDDTQLRTLEERLVYLRELEDRRAAILASIAEQGKLTEPLRLAIEAGVTSRHRILGEQVLTGRSGAIAPTFQGAARSSFAAASSPT
jgi:uncharacterized protein